MRPRLSIFILGFVFLLAGLARGSDPGYQKLRSEDEAFLSRVGYIITPAERKEFLALPEGKRENFIEEFWKRRDPDPATAENEFRDEYLGRISQAERLFFGEGRPGWLTDRGRIYVLFGPPDQRSAASSAARPDGRCQELWYYRDFPVVFLDRTCTGTFRLATLDLSPIADLSLARESAPKPLLPKEKKAPYDFDISLKRRKAEGAKLDVLVEISIPYSAIWLSLEGGKFVTTFELELTLKDNQGTLRWEKTESYGLSLTADELKQKLNSDYQISIPLLVEKDGEALIRGTNKLLIVLRNKRIGEEIRKTVEFSL